MSRDHQKSFSISKSSINNQRENNLDDNQRYHRKRTNSNSTRSNDHSNLQRTLNLDAKVYVGNVPTENLTDGELLQFFKPFGKISDIRVYKDYIFVQYDRIDDATKLIKQGQNCLMLKGNKLDVLPAMNANSIETSFKHYKNSEQQLSTNSHRHSDYDRHSSNYEPPTKRYQPKYHNDHYQPHKYNSINNQNKYGDSNVMKSGDNLLSSSENCSRRLSRCSNNSVSVRNESCYTILTGPDDETQLVDCRIIIVNPRQRGYAEEISSRLHCNGIITSIILLREDYTLTEAIQNARNDHCLYGIIAMPMHEERHTASFHILYGQTEEHRNLTLEDGYHIILTNFTSYKERIRNEEINNCESIICPSSTEFVNEEELINPKLTISDKFPLSMLLCLLADGRQLTLDEIDRVLVYLLEKKAKMLTLPEGTLPPLPKQYATIQTGQSKSILTTKDLSSSSSSSLSSTIAEQIRQILSTNLINSSCLNSNDEQISNLIENEEKNVCQSNININQGEKDLNNYQEKCEPSFSYSKSNSNSIDPITPSFHYSSSIPTNVTSSNTFNSPLKQSTTSHLTSQYLYPSISTQNLYQTLPNSAAADAAAAIFQAYSQFNARTTPFTNTQHQQIQK